MIRDPSNGYVWIFCRHDAQLFEGPCLGEPKFLCACLGHTDAPSWTCTINSRLDFSCAPFTTRCAYSLKTVAFGGFPCERNLTSHMDNEMRPPQPKRPLALPLGARSTQFGHLSQGSTSSSAPVSASSSGNGTSPPADFASSLESAAVWQCAACRQVLADSNSFVCNIPQLKLIVVSGKRQ